MVHWCVTLNIRATIYYGNISGQSVSRSTTKGRTLLLQTHSRRWWV